MIVEDEPGPLESMLGAVSRRYGGDYRVAAHRSANAALDDLEQIRAAGEPVALVIADQWMPEMTGVDLLRRTHEIHPAAQRALLVNWGDREASSTILEGCSLGHLENYLIKPWSPPEVHLYPLIGEFLSAWTRAHGPRMELVRVVGDNPSPRAHEICDYFERNGIPHGFYTADSEPGRALMEQAGIRELHGPAVIMLDGHVLMNPSNTELADQLGASDLPERNCDLTIIGAGPAGLAAGVYAASEGLRTVIVEREVVGGQAGTSSLIRNYLGFPRGISGAELAQRAYQQAWLFGAKYALGRQAVSLSASGADRIVTLSDGTETRAKAVLITTGVDYRRLGISNLDRFTGAGLYYAAGGDNRFYKGKLVMVAGGGNSAGQAVVHLAKTAKRVTLLIRADSLARGMSDYLVQEINRLANVDVRLNTEAVDGAGDHLLERVTIMNRETGDAEDLEVDAFFVLVGAQPHTEWLAGAIERDVAGFIVTGADLNGTTARGASARPPMRFETSMPGVFSAGDVRMGSLKRVASAVGEGAVVLNYIHEYLKNPVSL